jgi:ATP-binding cassette subfamily F protein 3
MANEVILRFNNVKFEYQPHKLLLDEASFSLRTNSRIALMGQNGAGKSTIFKLITGEIKPLDGEIFRTPNDATVGIAKQTLSKDQLEMSVRDYFSSAFQEKKYNLDKLIANVFAVVNLEAPLDKKLKEFSGGQQARLLLAFALIQEPDILLLDEPTNNLDQAGIEHLTGFLMLYEKTCLVISHDADFLNAFTEGVLYLDSYTRKVEQYTGNYYDAVEEIGKRIERENLQNARAEAEIRKLKEQAEQFAHKGGKLRAVAKRMRENAEEAEESKVEVRREDKTIRDFEIPVQTFPTFWNGVLATITSVSAMQNGEVVEKKKDLLVRKGTHLLISGPNGIGKSTLIDKIANRTATGVEIPEEVTIGYYKQDFSNFDYNKTGLETLLDAMPEKDEQRLRATAASFLIDGKALGNKIGDLSEGQKGLLAFCRLVLMKPGLLILDEPTNHINFRHLPIIAKALDAFEGGLIMVSHIPDFVSQIRIDEEINLENI